MTDKQFEFYCQWRARIVSNYDRNAYIELLESLQHDIWLERMSLIETAWMKDEQSKIT